MGKAPNNVVKSGSTNHRGVVSTFQGAAFQGAVFPEGNPLMMCMFECSRDEEIYKSMKALDQVIDEEYASLSQFQRFNRKSEKKIKEK